MTILTKIVGLIHFASVLRDVQNQADWPKGDAIAINQNLCLMCDTTDTGEFLTTFGGLMPLASVLWHLQSCIEFSTPLV